MPMRGLADSMRKHRATPPVQSTGLHLIQLSNDITPDVTCLINGGVINYSSHRSHVRIDCASTMSVGAWSWCNVLSLGITRLELRVRSGDPGMETIWYSSSSGLLFGTSVSPPSSLFWYPLEKPNLIADTTSPPVKFTLMGYEGFCIHAPPISRQDKDRARGPNDRRGVRVLASKLHDEDEDEDESSHFQHKKVKKVVTDWQNISTIRWRMTTRLVFTF